MPFDAAPPRFRTLADVIALIESDTTLTEVQRRDYASAVRRISEALGKEPAALPADLDRLRPMINALSPHRLGITPKTLANWRSNFLKSMNHVGGARQRRVALTPEWAALRRLISDQAMSAGLSRFMQFCSTRSVAPGEVDDNVIAAFVESLRQTLVPKPNQVHRRTCQLWRDAVRTIAGWPQHTVTLPDYRKPPTSLPLTAFPQTFSEDIEAYLQARSSRSPFDQNALAQWKPGTIRQSRTDLRLAASALVYRGVPTETITDLKALVEPVNVRETLLYYFDKETPRKKKGTWTTFSRGLHRCLSTVAAHWVKAPAEQLAELRALRTALGREANGMTDKNLDMLRQFYALENRKRLYGLPAKLAGIARSIRRRSGNRAVVLMQTAVAIEILLHAPVRMSNLIAIDIGQHLVRPGGSKELSCLVFREDETKNAEPLEYELTESSSSLLQEYIDQFRPLFGQGASALFPSYDCPRKSQGTLASQIGETILEYTGLRMTPHQFRHLAAAMILDQVPNALHLVQRMLGHKSPKTTLRFYAGLNPRSAARLMADLVKKIREH